MTVRTSTAPAPYRGPTRTLSIDEGAASLMVQMRVAGVLVALAGDAWYAASLYLPRVMPCAFAPVAAPCATIPLALVGGIVGPLLVLAGVLVARATRGGEAMGMFVGGLALFAAAVLLGLPSGSTRVPVLVSALVLMASAWISSVALACRHHPIAAELGPWLCSRLGLFAAYAALGLAVVFVVHAVIVPDVEPAPVRPSVAAPAPAPVALPVAQAVPPVHTLSACLDARSLGDYCAPIGGLEVSRDGALVAVVTARGDTLSVWSTRTRELLWRKQLETLPNLDALHATFAFSPDGTRVSIGDRAQNVKDGTFAMGFGVCEYEPRAPSKLVSAVAFDARGGITYASSGICNGPFHRVPGALFVRRSECEHASSLAYSPDGSVLWAACGDDVEGFAPRGDHRVRGPLTAPHVRRVAPSPDGRELALVADDVTIVDARTLKARLTVAASDFGVSSFTDARFLGAKSLVVAGRFGAYVIDARTGARKKALAEGAAVNAIGVQADGKRVWTGELPPTSRATVRAWSVE